MQSPDKFKCKLCQNAYAYEGTLKTHVMIVHCKINSYSCSQCEYHKPDPDGNETQTTKEAKVMDSYVFNYTFAAGEIIEITGQTTFRTYKIVEEAYYVRFLGWKLGLSLF